MFTSVIPTGFPATFPGLGGLPLMVDRLAKGLESAAASMPRFAGRIADPDRIEAIRRGPGGGKPATHALVLHRGGGFGTPEGHQIQGFQMNQRALQKELGMTVEMVQTDTLADIETAIKDRPADVVFVMVSWREKPEDVTSLFRRLNARANRPTLVFLDYFAPASSPFFGVMPYVDCYFKRQMYRDPSLYAKQFAGGNLFTDYIAKEMGYDLDGWDFSSTPDPDHLHKMTPGWNLGVSPRYRTVLKLSELNPIPWTMRPFAVNCRLGLMQGQSSKTEWYQHYRQHWGRQVAPLKEDFRCTGSNRVGQRRYLAEMLTSRIGVSPFGWGEVCFRDYEIVAAGALLVKPSMDHLATNPDIFVAGKTYVASAWDGSDVVEICRHYLAHPEEAQEIIHNGREALRQYYNQGGFVQDVARIVETATLNRVFEATGACLGQQLVAA